MQRRFFSSLFLLLALNLLVKPIWIFAIDRQVQNVVGIVEYGKYFSLFNLSIIFNFLLDIGLTTYLNQKKASGHENNLFIKTGSLKLFLGICYALVLIIVALLSGVTNSGWLALLGANQFLFSFFIFLRSNITALQLFKADAFFSVLDKIIVIVACGVLIYFPAAFGSITIYSFLLIQLFAIAIAIITAFIILLANEKIKVSPVISLDIDIIRQALPFGVIVLLMSTHSRADAFLLERLHPNGAYEAGIYAQAYRLLDAANMLGYLAASFLLPFIAKHFFEGKHIQPVINRTRNILLLFSIITAAICFLYADKIQVLLYHTSNEYAAAISIFCLSSLIGYSLVQIYGTVLTATGFIRLFIRITIPFMVLNILLNIFFIPSYGAKACSIIALVTQSLYGVSLYYYTDKKVYHSTASS